MKFWTTPIKITDGYCHNPETGEGTLIVDGKIWTDADEEEMRQARLAAEEKEAFFREMQADISNKPNFVNRGTRIGALVDEKNKSYGDSFTKSASIMHILYPQGMRPEQYRDALGIIRVIDKLFRIANQKDAFAESPWDDIAGYGIVAGDREPPR